MKITRKALKQLIFESMQELHEDETVQVGADVSGVGENRAVLNKKLEALQMELLAQVKQLEVDLDNPENSVDQEYLDALADANMDSWTGDHYSAVQIGARQYKVRADLYAEYGRKLAEIAQGIDDTALAAVTEFAAEMEANRTPDEKALDMMRDEDW